jgi:hypothetical protein
VGFEEGFAKLRRHHYIRGWKQVGFILFMCRYTPTRSLRFLDHTYTHTHTHTLDRTPLNQRTARRGGRYLHITRQTQQRNIHTLSGIRARNASNQAAADLRLRPHVH